MATDLDQIFTGVTCRRVMHRQHYLINDGAVFNDFAQVLGLRRQNSTAVVCREKTLSATSIASLPEMRIRRDRRFACRSRKWPANRFSWDN